MNKMIGETHEGFYYLKINKIMDDRLIAEYLELDFDDYCDIVDKYNPIYPEGDIYFTKYEDIENCLRELEPYIVLARLIR